MPLLKKSVLGLLIVLAAMFRPANITATVRTMPASDLSVSVHASSSKAGSLLSSSRTDAVTLSAGSVTLPVGQTYTLSAKIGPSSEIFDAAVSSAYPDTAAGNLRWTSSDAAVAGVNDKGEITAVGVGTCSIKASLPNGNSSACTVTVTGKQAVSIRLSGSSLRLLNGHTAVLKASVIPSDAAEKFLIWKSSNPSVAAVDASGKVTAKSTGTCVITVSSTNSISASCTITVAEPVPVASVTVSMKSVSVTRGGTYLLKASVRPSGATSKALKWETSNPAVATVSGSGKVTAKSTGTCHITVSSTNNKMDICVVTVTVPAPSQPGTGTSPSSPKNSVLNVSVSQSTDGYYSDNLTVSGSAFLDGGIKKITVYLDSLDSTGYPAHIGTANSSGTKSFTCTISSSAVNRLPFANNHYAYVVATGSGGAQIQQKSDSFVADSVTNTYYNISLSSTETVQAAKYPAMDILTGSGWQWEFAAINPSGVKGYYKSVINPANWVPSDNDYSNIISSLGNYMNPAGLINDPVQRYQFLKLSYVDCATAAQLNAQFKGVLSGYGEVFMNAAKQNNVNPVYLAGHSMEETANGSSQLAHGVYVAAGSYMIGNMSVNVAKSGTYYNLFGIQALDSGSGPVVTGAEYAASRGWSTVESAICGGAQWIASNYINNCKYTNNHGTQDTIYKMRWNPANPGVHQYATDIKWAYNQMNDVKACFDYFSGVPLAFDIPNYAH